MPSNLDLFLEIAEIPGESGKAGHEKQMDISSWTFSANQQVSMGGQGTTTGKVSMSDVSVTKNVDAGSPKLFLFCCGGNRIPKVWIHGQRSSSADAGQKAFYKVEMDNVVISNVRNDYVDPEGDEPASIVETITFNPEKVKVHYAAFDNKGSPQAFTGLGWDMFKNVKL